MCWVSLIYLDEECKYCLISKMKKMNIHKDSRNPENNPENRLNVDISSVWDRSHGG